MGSQVVVTLYTIVIILWLSKRVEYVNTPFQFTLKVFKSGNSDVSTDPRTMRARSKASFMQTIRVKPHLGLPIRISLWYYPFPTLNVTINQKEKALHVPHGPRKEAITWVQYFQFDLFLLALNMKQNYFHSNKNLTVYLNENTLCFVTDPFENKFIKN